MSVHITPRAYDTRLGNPTAKSILALVADCSNPQGYGWPRVDYIAEKTEVKLRTVLRMLQVFVVIGLVTKVDRGNGSNFGIQLNLDVLGSDLSEVFAKAYELAQSKCRSDSGPSVAATPEYVAETLFSVAATLPPHPLLGRTVNEPLLNQTPPSPSCEEGAKGKEPIEDVAWATGKLCEALGIVDARDQRRLRAVVQLEIDQGESPPEVLRKMLRAEQRQREARIRGELTASYGVMNFYRRGVWKHEGRWHWNEELLRKRAEAGTGSFQ